MTPSHSIQTPTGSAGAIAIIRVHHPDPTALGLPDPGGNRLALADFFGIDRGVILRADPSGVLLMPHGGIAIVRSISRELAALGVPRTEEEDPVLTYPEARTQIEAWMLAALARAASPDAIGVLLDHGARWEALGVGTIQQAHAHPGSGRHDALSRLIHPALVAAVGRANVGKSALVNALADGRVSLVADVAGTTRDHVGVLVNLGGLVVRWVDTPGIDERIAQGEEIDLAMAVIARADLVVHCIDPADQAGALDPRLGAAIGPDIPVLRVGTRADTGTHTVPIGERLSITAGGASGLESLVRRIRSVLVPRAEIEDPSPWPFWDSLSA